MVIFRRSEVNILDSSIPIFRKVVLNELNRQCTLSNSSSSTHNLSRRKFCQHVSISYICGRRTSLYSRRNWWKEKKRQLRGLLCRSRSWMETLPEPAKARGRSQRMIHLILLNWWCVLAFDIDLSGKKWSYPYKEFPDVAAIIWSKIDQKLIPQNSRFSWFWADGWAGSSWQRLQSLATAEMLILYALLLSSLQTSFAAEQIAFKTPSKLRIPSSSPPPSSTHSLTLVHALHLSHSHKPILHRRYSPQELSVLSSDEGHSNTQEIRTTREKLWRPSLNKAFQAQRRARRGVRIASDGTWTSFFFSSACFHVFLFASSTCCSFRVSNLPSLLSAFCPSLFV